MSLKTNRLISDQLNPYAVNPLVRTAPSGNTAGGKTLWVIVGIIGGTLLIGMILGIGLGVGAAGIISDLSLVNVTNSTG